MLSLPGVCIEVLARDSGVTAQDGLTVLSPPCSTDAGLTMWDGVDWDLYFCGSYGKIGKQLFDMGAPDFRAAHLAGMPGGSLGRRRLLRGAERARDVPETQKKCGRLACLDETGRLKIGCMPIIGLFKARLWALFCCLSEFCGTGYPKPPPRGENGRV